MQPTLSDIADHEACHAVVWWWMSRQPENVVGVADGWIDVVTIEADGPRLGETIPGHTVFSPVDRYGCLTLVCMVLAGPVSDELRGQHVDQVDEVMARSWASQYTPANELDGYLSAARDHVRDHLRNPDVRARVRRLAEALLVRTTIEGPEVLALLEVGGTPH